MKGTDASRLARGRERNRIKRNVKRAKIRQMLWKIKEVIGCQECGNHDYRMLEFHHLDPKKKRIAVSNMAHSSPTWRTIFIELSKCVVVCRNCHAKKQFTKRRYRADNGL